MLTNNLKYKLDFIYPATYETLEDFVKATAIESNLCGFTRFKDYNNIFGLGANTWYRVWYCYQNKYSSSYSLDGMLIITSGNNIKLGFITGTISSDNVSLSWGSFS